MTIPTAPFAANMARFAIEMLLAVGATCAFAQSTPSLPNGIPPMGVDVTPPQITQAAAPVRAGAKLTPNVWKNGARVAVCFTFDVDNEFHNGGAAAPVQLSTGEYGATTGLPRILALLDREQIPASFYIPAGAVILHPEMIQAILKSGRHEVGVHGWIHEYIPGLTSAAEEDRLLHQAIDYLTEATGKRPVGYRAPDWEFGTHTLDLIRKAGFLYDSSMMAMDQPYELMSHGKHTGLIELPVSWALDDFAYFGLNSNGSLPLPESVFQIFRSEFDVAYQERTLVVLTMHPAVSGLRSRVVELEKLVAYMKSKPDVWFATGEQVASYVKASQRVLQ
jgi:peptidoglycan/xylan/chitin deacetylase (PgdA/CDA1 family)